MTQGTSNKLSDKELNILENISRRVAEKNSGLITPNHVLPYIPVSLDIIKTALDQMADGTTVVKIQNSEYLEYEFTAFKDQNKVPGMLDLENCSGCDTALAGSSKSVLCSQCSDLLRTKLNKLAEKTGWPAQAAYEHNFLFHAAEKENLVQADDLASTSRYTLRSTRKKLGKMTVEYYTHQELDNNKGVIKYRFPEAEYPRDYYDANMNIIMTYPASIMEEVEIKITKILIALGILFLIMLGLAFYGIPFPVLLLILAILGPIMAMRIWRKRTNVEE